MMSRLLIFRLLWCRPDLCPQPRLMPADRRRGMRHRLVIPLRLRLGADLFHGEARDLSSGGIGLQFHPRPDNAPLLDRALAGHTTGALDVPFGHDRIVARVRIAHVERSADGIQVGLAFENSEEVARLVRRLEDWGTRTGGASRWWA